MTKISHLAVLLSPNPQTYPQELGITWRSRHLIRDCVFWHEHPLLPLSQTVGFDSGIHNPKKCQNAATLCIKH